MLRKVNNLKFRGQPNNFCVYINISSFFKWDIQYFWQREISICKVLVPIKVVPPKNNYFLHQKLEIEHVLK